ncbi:hypothetical protein HBN50_11900 [Halobacteriovorax sp. GB3]|uniref:hypothetical protein n=1 Tax=Halobacteriovorax sp. GB3 TaxID=2719615 RepID=UPI00235F673A|nr:hypothetical protein [Halobacteriovorax sp. GB3]MDD0853804.1 hypothetical protein [Halobacteriovorax sp. GB3]
MKSKLIVLIISSILLCSCGKTKQEEIDAELVSAEIDLTRGDCEAALSKLTGIDYQNSNAHFLKLLASAYACKAGYSSITFFSDDLPLIDAASLLSSFATFSTSDSMDSPTEEDYINIQSAINVLLYAGGIATTTNPTSTLRSSSFTSKESAQIHSLLMFLIMVNMGQYTYFYGNTSSTGVKGGGSGSNDCFMTYDATISDLFDGDPGDVDAGNCDNAADTGHPNLDNGTVNIERACEGVVLMNNFFEVFPEVISGALGDDFDVLDSISITDLKSDASTALGVAGKGTDILSTTSQSVCESDISDEDTFRYFFVMFFELLHNKV